MIIPAPKGYSDSRFNEALKLAHKIRAKFASSGFFWFQAGPDFVRLVDLLFRAKFHREVLTKARIAALATPEVGIEIGKILQQLDVKMEWDKIGQSQEHEQFLFLQIGILRCQQLREGKGDPLSR